MVCCVEVLQNACYDYGMNYFPGLLQRKDYKCSERVEMAEWRRLFAHAEAIEARAAYNYKGVYPIFNGKKFDLSDAWYKVVLIRDLDAHNKEVANPSLCIVAYDGGIFNRLLSDEEREAFLIVLDEKTIKLNEWFENDTRDSRQETEAEIRELRTQASEEYMTQDALDQAIERAI